MKSKIVKRIKEPKKFKPFQLQIDIESLDEARVFFHIFNNGTLVDKIKKGWYRDNESLEDGDYNELIIRDLENMAYEDIELEVESQGFKI